MGNKIIMSQNRPFILIYTKSDYADLIIDKFRQINKYTVFSTYDKSEEVLEFLRSNNHKSGKPDIILFDIDNFSGENQKLLEELKSDKDLRYIPLIVISNSDKDEDIAAAYNSYANSYIVKSKTQEGIESIINSIAGFWLSVVRFPHPD